MNEQIKNLIDTLHEADVKLDATQLAEALWLAEHIKLESDKDEVVKISLWDSLKKIFDFKFDFRKNKQETVSKVEDKSVLTQEVKEIEEKQASLSLPKNTNNQESTHYISPPKKRDIFITEKLLKSLLGLKQKSTSAKKEILCEDGTIEFLAKTGVVKPIFKGKKESSFELFLVVDTSSSMEIWQQSIGHFEKKLRAYKIFNKITMLYLDTSLKEAKLYNDKRKEVASSLTIFKNLNQRALTFLLSDAIDLAWRNTTVLSLIYEIQKNVPTVFINMLPYRMWSGTILNHTNITNLVAPNFYTRNKNLKSEVDRKLLKLDKAYFTNNRVLKLPVINLREDDFIAISNVIRGIENNRVSGIVVNLDKVEEKVSLSSNNISALESVQNYIETSSDMAIELAAYMSVVRRVNINIMQIVQKIMLEDSTQTDLSEFFLGGLLIKSKEGDFYEFKDGVAELFLQELGNLKIHQTLYKISDEIAKEIGSSLDFKALLNPHYIGENEFNKDDKIFAFISPQTLKRLGGKYAQIADEITGAKKVKGVDEEDNNEWVSPITTLITPSTKRYQMGSNEREEEQPIHEVIINYDFEIASTPVTVGEFKVFVEETEYVTEAEKGDGAYVYDSNDWTKKKDASWKKPYFEQTDEHPVVCVSWNDAQSYIAWLNEKTGETYRLPTEAEWEYACRAGSTTKWHFGDDEKELGQYAWYSKNSNNKTHPVAERLANKWGLHDMHGNVWEWCLDDWVDSYNDTARDGTAYKGESSGSKVLRGGSWGSIAGYSRSAYRFWDNPTFRYNDVGFRLLRTLP